MDSPHLFQPLKVVKVYRKTSTLAGSLRNFGYASTMDFFGCPANHLWVQGISTINLKWQKISGAENIIGIGHHFSMVYLYSVFTVKKHCRNASTSHLNVPQSPISLKAFAMDFSTKKCQSWRSGSMASRCVILKPFKYFFPWDHIGAITH